MQLSKYLTLERALKSNWSERNGIPNTIDGDEKDIIKNLKFFGVTIYDPICDHFGVLIPGTSFYRNKLVNKGVKGSKTSDHMRALAGDLDPENAGGVLNSELFHYIRTSNLPFNQLIWEFGNDKEPAWVHVSAALVPKRQVLRAITVKEGNKIKTKYINY